jgi:hypothetical protein
LLFTGAGAFRLSPPLDTKCLERLFRAGELVMLSRAGRLHRTKTLFDRFLR